MKHQFSSNLVTCVATLSRHVSLMPPQNEMQAQDDYQRLMNNKSPKSKRK